MKNVLLFSILSLVFISCISQIKRDLFYSKNKNLMQDAIKAYIYYHDSIGANDKVRDTLKFYNKIFESGCYIYGAKNSTFYYGFIDVKYDMTKESLLNFKRYQEFLNDTLILNDFKFNVGDREIYIMGDDSYKSYYHLTPLWCIDSLRYSFGIHSLGYDTGVTENIYLRLINNRLICDTIITDYHDHFTMPCQLAPDTLRKMDFDILFEKYGVKK